MFGDTCFWKKKNSSDRLLKESNEMLRLQSKHRKFRRRGGLLAEREFFDASLSFAASKSAILCSRLADNARRVLLSGAYKEFPIAFREENSGALP